MAYARREKVPTLSGSCRRAVKIPRASVVPLPMYRGVVRKALRGWCGK
jgi:hypothetical protein